jgi:ABC-type glycerol-3-phosphate transport system substrate-binding protein
MYKIIDWILANKRTTVLISILTIFTIGLLLTLAFLNQNNVNTSGTKPLLTNKAEVPLTWWIDDEIGQNQKGYDSLMAAFIAKGYPGTTFEIKSKKDSLEFINDFISLPDSQPDIVTINNKHIPFFQKFAMPSVFLTGKELQDYIDRSVEIVKSNTVANNTIFAVPMYVDNLVMYRNVDKLQCLSDKSVAKTWQKLQSQVGEFVSSCGNLVAISRDPKFSKNSGDIIATMLLQKGFDPLFNNIDLAISKEVVSTFTDLEKSKQDTTKTALDQFKEGRSMYYIDYYSTLNNIQDATSINIAIENLPSFDGLINLNQSRFQGTMLHKKNKTTPTSTKAAKDKETILQNFLYFLSTEEARQVFADNSTMPSTSINILDKQEKNDSSIAVRNIKGIYNSSKVSKAVMPTCLPKYKAAWAGLIDERNKSYNIKADTVVSIYFDELKQSLSPVSTCLPFTLTD